MNEPWLNELVRQRHEERLAASERSRLFRHIGGPTQRPNTSGRLGLVFARTRARAFRARVRYPAGTDAGARL